MPCHAVPRHDVLRCAVRMLGCACRFHLGMVLGPSSTVAECLPVCLWRRPRELPVEAGQTLVGLELKRLGIKAAW